MLDLFGGRPGESDHDIDHWDLDLRLLLAWRDEHSERAEQK